MKGGLITTTQPSAIVSQCFFLILLALYLAAGELLEDQSCVALTIDGGYTPLAPQSVRTLEIVTDSWPKEPHS